VPHAVVYHDGMSGTLIWYWTYTEVVARITEGVRRSNADGVPNMNRRSDRAERRSRDASLSPLAGIG
jgi:hypothetical protein